MWVKHFYLVVNAKHALLELIYFMHLQQLLLVLHVNMIIQNVMEVHMCIHLLDIGGVQTHLTISFHAETKMHVWGEIIQLRIILLELVPLDTREFFV